MQSAKRKMQSVKCRVCDAIFIPLPSPAVTPSPRRGKANLGSTLEGRGHPVDAELAMSEPVGE